MHNAIKDDAVLFVVPRKLEQLVWAINSFDTSRTVERTASYDLPRVAEGYSFSRYLLSLQGTAFAEDRTNVATSTLGG